MRAGVRIAIDVGRSRIGVARSDPQGTLALPVETIARDRDGSADIARIREIAAEYGAFEVLVGLPLSLSGASTHSTDDAVEFAGRIRAALNTDTELAAADVRLVDERMSTVIAQSHMHASGLDVKKSRSRIDQAAATVILESALDFERQQEKAPGRAVPTARDAAAHERTVKK